MTKEIEESGVATIEKDATDIKEPKLYQVLLLNDDYTTMDFVIAVLEEIFKKNPSESMQIMLNVHNKGRGVCGVFSKQIAEAKIAQVHSKARKSGFPLRCALEPK